MSLTYLLCFEIAYAPYPGAPDYKCAEHYTGSVRGGPRALAKRLAQHGTEKGAKLMLAVKNAGIGWQLARVWNGGVWRERQLKAQGGAKRRCPLCGVIPRFRRSDLPRNRRGCLARSLMTEDQKCRAGVMTTFQRADHTKLRQGAVTGRVCGVRRIRRVPTHDPWYAIPVVAGRTCQDRSSSAHGEDVQA